MGADLDTLVQASFLESLNDLVVEGVLLELPFVVRRPLFRFLREAEDFRRDGHGDAVDPVVLHVKSLLIHTLERFLHGAGDNDLLNGVLSQEYDGSAGIGDLSLKAVEG